MKTLFQSLVVCLLLSAGSAFGQYKAKIDVLNNTCVVNSSLAASVTCAGTTGVIEVPTTLTTPIALAGNVTIPSGVTLKFNGGSSCITTTGFTLTINGPIVAPVSQIFCGTGTVTIGSPTVVYPQWFPGSDLGAQIGKASAAIGAGEIWLAGENGATWSTAVTLKAGQSIHLVQPATITATCATCLTMNFIDNNLISPSSAQFIVNYSGSASFIVWRMSPTNSTQAGTVQGITISCNSCGSSANGIHMGDIVGSRLRDVHIVGFTGASSSCLWTDNVNAWTERTVEEGVHLDNCTKLHRWTNTAGLAVTASFGHMPFIDERWNLSGNQTGWSVEGGSIYDAGYVGITGNALGVSANTLFALSGLVYTGGGGTTVSASQWSENVEQTSGTASNIYNLAAGTNFSGCGWINPGGFTTGTVTGTLNFVTACTLPNNTSLTFYNSSGAIDSILALGAANVTVLRGDPTQKQIFIQADAATDDIHIGTTNVAIQSGRALTPASSTVGSLPAAASFPGGMFFVTDSTAVAAEGQTCVGSSTNKALAVSNGTVWKCF
jgi:hypothetical protein